MNGLLPIAYMYISWQDCFGNKRPVADWRIKRGDLKMLDIVEEKRVTAEVYWRKNGVITGPMQLDLGLNPKIQTAFDKILSEIPGFKPNTPGVTDDFDSEGFFDEFSPRDICESVSAWTVVFNPKNNYSNGDSSLAPFTETQINFEDTPHIQVWRTQKESRILLWLSDSNPFDDMGKASVLLNFLPTPSPYVKAPNLGQNSSIFLRNYIKEKFGYDPGRVSPAFGFSSKNGPCLYTLNPNSKSGFLKWPPLTLTSSFLIFFLATPIGGLKFRDRALTSNEAADFLKKNDTQGLLRIYLRDTNIPACLSGTGPVDWNNREIMARLVQEHMLTGDF
jgi:hypothetical protein